MKTNMKIAVDNKIKDLGKSGCRDFWYKINYAPSMNKLFERDYIKAIRSLLCGEDWDDLTRLFINWKVS